MYSDQQSRNLKIISSFNSVGFRILVVITSIPYFYQIPYSIYSFLLFLQRKSFDRNRRQYFFTIKNILNFCVSSIQNDNGFPLLIILCSFKRRMTSYYLSCAFFCYPFRQPHLISYSIFRPHLLPSVFLMSLIFFNFPLQIMSHKIVVYFCF